MQLRVGPSGPLCGSIAQSVLTALFFGVVGPQSEVFFLVSVPGAGSGDLTYHTVVGGGLPAGLTPSRSIVFAVGIVAVGFMNITAAPLAPLSDLTLEVERLVPRVLRIS